MGKKKDKEAYEETRKRLAHQKWEAEKKRQRERAEEDRDERDD